MAREKPVREDRSPREKKFDPKAQLDPVDLKILQYKVESPKLSLEDIGRLVGGISRQAVSKRTKKQAFQDAWNKLELDTIARLRGMKVKAALVYDGLLSDPNRYLRYRAARDILKSDLQSARMSTPPPKIDELKFTTSEGEEL